MKKGIANEAVNYGADDVTPLSDIPMGHKVALRDIAKALAGKAQIYVGGFIKGVYAFPHPYGCSQMGGDQENTRQALANLFAHLNAGGVLLGLGCENNGIDKTLPHMGAHDPARLRTLISQQVEDEQEAAMALIGELAKHMRSDACAPCPADQLAVELRSTASTTWSSSSRA